MLQRSLHEQPYTGGPYESVAIDLRTERGLQRSSLTVLEGGPAWRLDADRWHHPQPSCDRLFCFVEGHADIETEHGRQRLRAGRIHLLPEGHPFTVTYSARSLLYYYHLRLLDGIRLPCFRHAQRIHILDQPALFSRVVEAVDQQDRPAQFSSLLECMLRFTAETAPPAATGERFADLFAYLDLNLGPDTRIADLAAVMGMQTAALSKAFQRSIGVPLKHYLQTRLMDRAKQALLFSEATVEQIAGDLGYNDPFYFSRAFKRFCGTSPSEFRRCNREPITDHG